ncbi:hypothetical protein IKQ21_04365 [bacterium]|nr:hypothetical protein [bacterium]
MSLNVQTNITIPQNNTTFRANENGLKTLFSHATGDVFIKPKQNTLNNICTRVRGFISKFKKTFDAKKCKNTAEELSKDELSILSNEEIALWKSANSKNSFEELTENERAIVEKICDKRSKDAFGDEGVEIEGELKKEFAKVLRLYKII